MLHREMEIVPDRGSDERKGTLSLKFLVSVCQTKYTLSAEEWRVHDGVCSSRRSERKGGAVQVIML